jgi:hypothetical protein
MSDLHEVHLEAFQIWRGLDFKSPEFHLAVAAWELSHDEGPRIAEARERLKRAKELL